MCEIKMDASHRTNQSRYELLKRCYYLLIFASSAGNVGTNSCCAYLECSMLAFGVHHTLQRHMAKFVFNHAVCM